MKGHFPILTLLFCTCQHLYTTLLLSLTPVVCGVVLYEHSSYLMCPNVYSPMVSLYIENSTLYSIPHSNFNFKPHPTRLRSTTLPHPLAHTQLSSSFQLSYAFLTLVCTFQLFSPSTPPHTFDWCSWKFRWPQLGWLGITAALGEQFSMTLNINIIGHLMLDWSKTECSSKLCPLKTTCTSCVKHHWSRLSMHAQSQKGERWLVNCTL